MSVSWNMVDKQQLCSSSWDSTIKTVSPRSHSSCLCEFVVAIGASSIHPNAPMWHVVRIRGSLFPSISMLDCLCDFAWNLPLRHQVRRSKTSPPVPSIKRRVFVPGLEQVRGDAVARGKHRWHRSFTRHAPNFASFVWTHCSPPDAREKNQVQSVCCGHFCDFWLRHGGQTVESIQEWTANAENDLFQRRTFRVCDWTRLELGGCSHGGILFMGWAGADSHLSFIWLKFILIKWTRLFAMLAERRWGVWWTNWNEILNYGVSPPPPNVFQ